MNKKLITQLNEMENEALQNLIEDAKDYALYRGIAKRDIKLSKDARIHLPFCLIPCEFPQQWYYYLYHLQKWLNLVLLKISYSKEFLHECLSSTIESDDFTRKNFDIFEEVFDSQREQMSLGLIRSDYLLNCYSNGIISGAKQVENNTFAAGLGGVSPLLKDLYEFIFNKLKWKDFGPHLVKNESCVGLAKGFKHAFMIYGKMDAVYLFVVEDTTFNILDQRILEYKILELHQFEVEILRCTFKDLRNNLQLKNSRIYVKGKEVAVVYYRVGYAPNHYEPEDWTTRLLIEKSKAIKCPSVGLHLAGSKRVQFCLTKPGVLEKFVDIHIAEQIRKVFAGQHSLDAINKNEEESPIANAIASPDSFVLKPEREGGGNNLYGLEMVKVLLKEQDKEIKSSSYILMDKIQPPGEPNYIVRSDRTPEPCLVNSELGIFGTILGNGDGLILLNSAVGHLLRCKSVDSNEGGIASDTGALSYPYLV